MKLSTKIRYGMRALLDLALNYTDKPVLLKDIAKRQEISFKYLDRIFSSLKAAGLIKSIRGAKGGFVLSRLPSEIKLFDIVHALEGPINLVECVDNKSYCKRSNACVVREVWCELENVIADELKSITLQDLVEKENRKRVSLAMYHI